MSNKKQLNQNNTRSQVVLKSNCKTPTKKKFKTTYIKENCNEDVNIEFKELIYRKKNDPRFYTKINILGKKKKLY
jgi:hypothetical protein